MTFFKKVVKGDKGRDPHFWPSNAYDWSKQMWTYRHISQKYKYTYNPNQNTYVYVTQEFNRGKSHRMFFIVLG